MQTQTTDTTSSSGTPTDSANTTPASTTASAPASTGGATTESAPAPKKGRKPNHTGSTVLGRYYRLRDASSAIDDPRVKADLTQATNAAHDVERETREIPGHKAALADAKKKRQTDLATLEARTGLVVAALKLTTQGPDITAGAKDPLPWLFAESLAKRIPTDLLGPDQVLVTEMQGSLRRFRVADQALADKQAALTEAAARYVAGTRELNLCLSMLQASLRGYQARQKSTVGQKAA